jgi:hypothetical protein
MPASVAHYAAFADACLQGNAMEILECVPSARSPPPRTQTLTVGAAG